MPKIGKGRAADAELYRVTNVDQQLPGKDRRRQARQQQDQDLEQAINELKDSDRFRQAGLSLQLDADRDLVLMTVQDPGGQRRVLRQMEPQEVLRLARALRAGRAGLMDLKL